MASQWFNGKNVLIFGGSSGIGLEAAKKLAARGAHIMIFARNSQKLEAALAEIEKHRLVPQQKFACLSVDVSDFSAVKELAETCVKDFGVPQILINCAGRAIPRYFEDISYQQFDETMKINLYGVWNTTSAFFPYMKERGGSIVNTSSVGGFLGVFGYADYAASKFGIIGLSEVLRSELRRYNIHVSVLCPPDTQTPGFDQENKTKPKETIAISEGGGLLDAGAVADALLCGIENGTPVIIPGLEGKLTHFLKRHTPFVLDLIMNRSIQKAQK